MVSRLIVYKMLIVTMIPKSDGDATPLAAAPFMRFNCCLSHLGLC